MTSSTARGQRSGLNGFLGGLVAALIVTVGGIAWTAHASGDNLGFTAVEPCRLIDTRPVPQRVGPHGTFGPDTTRTVDFEGRCDLPSNVSALSLNITAVNATAPTHIAVWASGAVPNASSLNPAPGQPPTPNAVIAAVAGSAFRAFNFQGSVDLIIDVNGYFAGFTGGGIGPTGTGFDAIITGYGPGHSITTVSGAVTSSRSDTASVRIDVRCPGGTVELDLLIDVPPGATRGWSVLCDGVFEAGASVTTILI